MDIKPPAEHVKNSHCSYCGTKFLEQKEWPRKCFICWNESYINPIPVVVFMLGVQVRDKMGILIQQRGIEPKKGSWALPSGYVNYGESWEEAAVRENMEEMNIKSVVNDYNLFDIKKPPSGNMLIFCTSSLLLPDDPLADTGEILSLVKGFVPNNEVLGMDIWFGDTELAFPSHNECAKVYLAQLKNTLSPWNY